MKYIFLILFSITANALPIQDTYTMTPLDYSTSNVFSYAWTKIVDNASATYKFSCKSTASAKYLFLGVSTSGDPSSNLLTILDEKADYELTVNEGDDIFVRATGAALTSGNLLCSFYKNPKM